MMEQSPDTQTPITRKINKFSKKLLYVVLGLAVVVLVVGLSRTNSWVDATIAAVAFAVAAIPEGKPCDRDNYPSDWCYPLSASPCHHAETCGSRNTRQHDRDLF